MRSTVHFLHALADETRWRIVEALLAQPHCVWDLADVLDLPRTTVSSHVRLMREAGLLISERAGRTVCHRIDDSHRPLLLHLRDHLGVSERTNATLRKDARRAERLTRARRR